MGEEGESNQFRALSSLNPCFELKEGVQRVDLRIILRCIDHREARQERSKSSYYPTDFISIYRRLVREKQENR